RTRFRTPRATTRRARCADVTSRSKLLPTGPDEVPRGPRTARIVSPGPCLGRLVAHGVGRAELRPPERLVAGRAAASDRLEQDALGGRECGQEACACLGEPPRDVGPGTDPVGAGDGQVGPVGP